MYLESLIKESWGQNQVVQENIYEKFSVHFNLYIQHSLPVFFSSPVILPFDGLKNRGEKLGNLPKSYNLKKISEK